MGALKPLAKPLAKAVKAPFGMAGRIESNMKTTAGQACAKTLLTVFNLIYLAAGIAILSLGIWMKVELYVYMELTTLYYAEAPWVLIGIGCGIIIITISGCCCTVKGNAFMLYMYSAFLVIVFIALLAGGIGFFVYRGKLEEGFSEGLDQAMKVYSSDENKKKAIDGIQQALKCCGHANYEDWFSIDWSGNGNSNSVPPTCCKDGTTCTNTDLTPGSNPDQIWTDGCFTTLASFMKSNFGIIGGVAIGFAFLQLFGALLACCLAKNINKSKYEQVA